MEPGDASFDLGRFLRVVVGIGHGRLVGLRHLDHGSDWAELAVEPAPHLAGEDGSIASGVLVTLMDIATSAAVWARQGRFRAHATLDLRLDHLRPAMAGRTIVARGECRRIAGNVAFVRGEAHDGDPADPIAHVVGTFMFTDR